MKDKIVISGMACRFPEADTYQNFWDNLLTHKDMVTTEGSRWSASSFNTPERYGKIKHPHHFDATFFGVHSKQAERMDPQLRLLLEISYEAFLDAGIDPDSLKGSNTGVFIGACFSDAQTIYFSDIENISGYENSGCSLSMFANRLSFFYDLHGPSQTLDTACSSSLVALDAAVKSINDGICDYAIVGGASMVFNPAVTMGFSKLKMLSPTGSCKSFDKDADGYARSEGIGVIILTRHSLAKRVRASVLGTAVNSDGYTDNGITFPSGDAQAELLSNLYHKCHINVDDVSYIEAHGTGTAAGDPQELNALDKALKLSNRPAETPLLIGSVKSNMGHAEGAAGIAGVIKVLLSMEHNTLPANLHYSSPNRDIPALIQKRIKVVDKNTYWEGGIVGINSFGFGGTNAHVVLQGGGKATQGIDLNQFDEHVPIIPFAARTASALEQVIDTCMIQEITPDAIIFLQGIANRNRESLPYRGCIVHNSKGDRIVHTGKANSSPMPVWFIFPGMGSQWQGMGAELLDYPTFKQSLEQSQRALQDTKINLVSLITEKSDEAYNKPSHVFCAITAIQIALLDLLREFGVKADGMVGHSVGEIACAYADGALSQQQAIMAAYYRGISIEQCPTSAGKMAVATLTWEEAQASCGQHIVAACHNSEYSVTLSGEATAIDDYVSKTTNDGGEVRLVDSTGIAFHSHLIAAAAPQLQRYLEDLIVDPMPRSERWICTSRPESEWADASLCSAEYFVDNLVKPVRFYDALKKIPDNALVVEIGPHSLMRAAIVDSLRRCDYVNFMRRDHHCKQVFLAALAQCYTHGLDIDWSANAKSDTNYPHDLSLCPVTGWDHSTEWKIPDYSSHSDHVYHIDIDDEQYAFISDHKLSGRVVFPGVGYLYLVWATVAKLCHMPISELKVQFSDVHFHRASMIPDRGAIDLVVRYLSATNEFEVVESEELVASGRVIYGDDINVSTYTSVAYDYDAEVCMNAADMYKELRLRGYNYGPAFQGIDKISLDGNHIRINWNNNWITFLDSMLHSSVVRHDRKTLLPTFIRNVTIDPTLQTNVKSALCYSDQYRRRIQSAAVEMEDFDFVVMPDIVQKDQPSLMSMEFIPYIQEQCIDKASDGQFINEYISITQAYILHRLNAFFTDAEHHQLDLPDYLLKLKSTLSHCQYEAPLDIDVERMKQHPKAILLRLAEHVYDNAEQLCVDAMPTIVSYAEYKQLYTQDLAFSFLFDDRYLGSAIQTVMQNKGASSPINIGEVGVGTGGIMAHILPKLRSRKDCYIGTDISSGFFENLKKEFSSYQAVTEYLPWDISKKKPKQFKQPLDLVVASNVIHAANNINEALSNIHDTLSDGGFFLLHETTHGYPAILGIWGFIDDIWQYNDSEERSNGAYVSKERWEELLDDAGFDMVSVSDDGHFHTLYLCRKRIANHLEHIMHDVKDIAVELTAIQTKLESINKDPLKRLWLQGTENHSPGLLGLVNCSRNEIGGEQIRAIYVDDNVYPNADELQANYNKDLAITVYKHGVPGGYYYLNMPKNSRKDTDNAYMDISVTGDLATLQWFSSPDYIRDHYEYDAHYCALNFKDVMLASGKLPPNALDGPLASSFGGEFAGVSPDGRRVMGFLSDSMTTKIRATREIPPNIWHVPDDWTLADAATVPVVYMTSFLALIIRADIQPGQRVLIHSGTGGVGQAAIRIALANGCEVFTTVGSSEKRKILKAIFPELQDTHIFSSRNTDFEGAIIEYTKGEGVHVVLNSLADDKLMASIRVLSRYGTFLEIGRYDMAKNTHVGMAMFLKDVRFIGVGLDNVLVDDLSSLHKLSKLMKEGIANGVVVPLQKTVFNHDQLEDAFRYMAKGKHTGKVLLKIRDEEQQTISCVSASPRYWCHPDKSYIVTGGLGGFGFELVRWLINRGAKHITLTSRSPIKNGYQAYWLSMWRKQGVDVTISHLNVADKVQTNELLQQVQSQYPVGGIYHLAMVLDDAFLTNQTTDKFKRVVDVKYSACRHLDKMSRDICPQLDNFVMFSSLSGGFGNPGQSNYGYANYAMDRLCDKRKVAGYPALSIQWGAIGDVGFINDNQGYVDIETLQMKEQSLSSCLDTLDNYLNQDKSVVASFVANCDIFMNAQEQLSIHADSERSQETLVRDIKNIIGIPDSTEVDENSPFISWGVDSLMTVEIVAKVDKDYGIRLALADVQHLSFALIKEMYRKHLESSLSNEATDSTLDQQQDANLNTDTDLESVFELYSGNLHASNVVYFINGFASDPNEILENIQCPDDSRIYLVRYEHTDNMDDLADLWDQHIRQLASANTTIRIVGHSTGATIIHRLKQLKDFSDLAIDIEFTAISAPKSDLFQLLDMYFPLDKIDDMPEDLGMTQLSTIPWYGKFKPIGYNDIRKQVRFIFNDHFYAKELSEVDKIILPKEDDLCWSVDEAQLLSKVVMEVDGLHDARTVPLDAILFQS